jgi:hypothetical protein
MWLASGFFLAVKNDGKKTTPRMSWPSAYESWKSFRGPLTVNNKMRDKGAVYTCTNLRTIPRTILSTICIQANSSSDNYYIGHITAKKQIEN